MGLMTSFERGMERFLVPVAIKLNSQKHVAAVRDGFVFTFPIIMASSLIILINFAILSPDGFIAGLLHLNSVFPNLEKAQAIFTPVMNGSVNIMSIMIAFLVARNMAISYDLENLSWAAQHGTTWGAPYPITWTSINDAFANCGGSGMTLGLLLAIFIASKRAEYRDLAKMSFIPGIFNINEPIMFGLPIVLNPIMMVPFILVPIVNCAVGYFFVSMEIIPPVAYAVPWTTPGPLIAFLGTGENWLALLVGFLCLGVATMIYLPFVIAANKVNNMTTNG